MSEPFDLERLRQAWNRGAPVAPSTAEHARLKGVGPAVDPHAEALAALEKVAVLAAERFPARAPALAVFVDEARALLAAVRAAEPGTRAAPLGEYLAALDRLEDLLEAFRLSAGGAAR
jgi:hypothetical protein